MTAGFAFAMASWIPPHPRHPPLGFGGALEDGRPRPRRRAWNEGDGWHADPAAGAAGAARWGWRHPRATPAFQPATLVHDVQRIRIALSIPEDTELRATIEQANELLGIDPEGTLGAQARRVLREVAV